MTINISDIRLTITDLTQQKIIKSLYKIPLIKMSMVTYFFFKLRNISFILKIFTKNIYVNKFFQISHTYWSQKCIV